MNKANGVLNHLNYPHPLPPNIDFTENIIAPLGEVILLEIYNVVISDADCHNARIEVCLLNLNLFGVKGNCLRFLWPIFRFMTAMPI